MRHLSDTHTLLLNKFNVVAHHALVITRAFESQHDPLNARWGRRAPGARAERATGQGRRRGATWRGAGTASPTRPYAHAPVLPPTPSCVRV